MSPRKKGCSRPQVGPLARPSGLTLIELVIVVLIMGILFSISVVGVSALTPLYRVRSASRTLGAQIEELRAIAIATGRPMGIRYTIRDDVCFYQMIPSAPEESPDEPVENRRLGVKHDLPPGVRIKRIAVPGGRPVDRGAINLIFSPMGTTGSHVVTIEGKGKNERIITISVKFNAITGTISFVQGEAELAISEG